MPDQEIMKQIRVREELRASRALDATMRLGIEIAPSVLADALAAIVDDWYATAELYNKAKLKGAQSTYIVPLRHAAAELDKVIKGLQQPRPGSISAVRDASTLPHPFLRSDDESDTACVTCGQRRPAAVHRDAAGLDEPTHLFKPGDDNRTCDVVTDGLGCGRFPSHPVHRLDGPTERPGLDALIAEAAGRVLDPLVLGGLPATALGPNGETVHGVAVIDEVQAYLRGEVDELPGADPGPSTVHDATYVGEQGPEPVAFTEDEIQKMIRAAREEGAKMPTSQIPPVPLLGQPGDAGTGYSPTYVPPGGVPLTFAELMTPVPAASLPAHLSHSQIEALADCPAKYRAQRLTSLAVIPRIPQWALIGGNAFHAAVESIERHELTEPGTVLPGGRVDPDAMWRHYFEAECAKIETSSPVPRSMWRASKQGAEGETWWNVSGPEMLRRYLAARPGESTANLADGNGALVGGIEVELTVDVPTPYGLIPYKVILDRVTQHTDPTSNWITLIIRDYKTGDRMPDSTSQLGEYANVLRLLGVPPQVKILGTFFNARKGTWMPEVDLDEAWPAEWFTYLVTSAESQRRALTSGPTPARPSSFCGGCSVRWACPIKGVRQAAS